MYLIVVPFQVPSAFMLTDCFIYAHEHCLEKKLFKGNGQQTVAELAAQEGVLLKKLIGALRALWRSSNQGGHDTRVADLKTYIQPSPTRSPQEPVQAPAPESGGEDSESEGDDSDGEDPKSEDGENVELAVPTSQESSESRDDDDREGDKGDGEDLSDSEDGTSKAPKRKQPLNKALSMMHLEETVDEPESSYQTPSAKKPRLATDVMRQLELTPPPVVGSQTANKMTAVKKQDKDAKNAAEGAIEGEVMTKFGEYDLVALEIPMPARPRGVKGQITWAKVGGVEKAWNMAVERAGFQ
eukprot:s2702_g11.t1